MAFKSVGFHVDVVSYYDLYETLKHHDRSLQQRFRQAHGLCLPGGFSFGDEWGSAQLLASSLRSFWDDLFHDWVHRRKPLIGICNGCQVLAKWGWLNFQPPRQLLTMSSINHRLSLHPNDSGLFIDRWVEIAKNSNHHTHLPWTHYLSTSQETWFWPARHGEGRFMLEGLSEEDIKNHPQSLFFYKESVNGSEGSLAAVTDPSGYILGIMPHPECDIFDIQNPAGPSSSFSQEENIEATFANLGWGGRLLKGMGAFYE
jgi:phosphoribosylformylglycinamidine synthase